MKYSAEIHVANSPSVLAITEVEQQTLRELASMFAQMHGRFIAAPHIALPIDANEATTDDFLTIIYK